MEQQREIRHLGYKCIGPTITPDRIRALQESLEMNNSLKELRGAFHALSGKTRIKILYLLQCEEELCVCDMADILGESISAISHQLKILRQHGFVKTRRDSQTIFYSVNSQVVQKYPNFAPEEVLL